MIDMLKRHAIQVLRAAGHGQSEIATLTDVSVRSVRRVEAEPDVSHVDDAGERDRRRIGRPSLAEPFRPCVVELLAHDPALLSVEIFRRAQLAGYAGGKSALYELIHAIRPNEQTETLVRTLVDHFTAIGGIPLLAVFDRPKTVALKWTKDGHVTDWNPLFAGVALDLGLGIEVCWPFSPEQKGSVENLVGWGKGAFFKQRRFLDDADLRTQLAEWRTAMNTERPSRATGVIPAERLDEERPRLRAVKIAPDDLALRVPIVVGPTAAVLHDTHPYSMPPDAIGIPGTLFLYRDRVRIVAGRFARIHP